VAEPDDDVAAIIHAFILGGVTGLSFRILMVWAVHVDGGIVFFVKEIRAGLAHLEELLGHRRQMVVVVLQKFEPVFFQLRTAKPT
jgi:hypothetical protein